MHLYILTRGIKHCVDRYINDLQAQYWHMPNGPVDPATGQQINTVQLGVRLVQFWEIVFPKERLAEVLPTVLPSGAHARSHNVWEKFLMKRLRALLHAKEIPEFNPLGARRAIFHQNVEVNGIGIKEDLHSEKDGHEML